MSSQVTVSPDHLKGWTFVQGMRPHGKLWERLEHLPVAELAAAAADRGALAFHTEGDMFLSLNHPNEWQHTRCKEQAAVEAARSALNPVALPPPSHYNHQLSSADRHLCAPHLDSPPRAAARLACLPPCSDSVMPVPSSAARLDVPAWTRPGTHPGPALPGEGLQAALPRLGGDRLRRVRQAGSLAPEVAYLHNVVWLALDAQWPGGTAFGRAQSTCRAALLVEWLTQGWTWALTVWQPLMQCSVLGTAFFTAPSFPANTMYNVGREAHGPADMAYMACMAIVRSCWPGFWQLCVVGPGDYLLAWRVQWIETPSFSLEADLQLKATRVPGKEATSNLPLISRQKMSSLAGQAVEGLPLYRCYSLKELWKLARSAKYSGWVGLEELQEVARPTEGDGWVWLQVGKVHVPPGQRCTLYARLWNISDKRKPGMVFDVVELKRVKREE
ncbi:hypothetical protein V8C86DRAFT_3027606 [Haematococcus lacustris]